MAANCLGSFGSYQYEWNRNRNQPEDNCATVWVTKRYAPIDLRLNAPVPRHKPVVPDAATLPCPDEQWIPPGEANPWVYIRDQEEKKPHNSQTSTRCEEWSTLRQMLPSSGRPRRHLPPNWGTGASTPPDTSFTYQRRFPHINSPMTRYVDDMHLTNRLFKLH